MCTLYLFVCLLLLVVVFSCKFKRKLCLFMPGMIVNNTKHTTHTIHTLLSIQTHWKKNGKSELMLIVVMDSEFRLWLCTASFNMLFVSAVDVYIQFCGCPILMLLHTFFFFSRNLCASSISCLRKFSDLRMWKWNCVLYPSVIQNPPIHSNSRFRFGFAACVFTIYSLLLRTTTTAKHKMPFFLWEVFSSRRVRMKKWQPIQFPLFPFCIFEMSNGKGEGKRIYIISVHFVRFGGIIVWDENIYNHFSR